MELRVLRYLLAVAREGTFTGAAQLLNVTQPTISRQIQELEEVLGKQLLERKGGNGATLTEDGRFLVQRAEEILSMVDNTEAALRDTRKHVSGKVAIGVGEFPAVRWLAKRLRALRADYPGITFNFVTSSADEIGRQLDAGLLDFALQIAPVDPARYASQILPERAEWCAVLRKDHPLAEKAALTPEDLASEGLIVPRRFTWKGNRSLAWFGGRRIVISTVSDLAYTTRLLADEGLGIALSLNRPRMTAEFPHLVAKPLSPPLTTDMAFVWKTSRPFSLAAKLVAQACGVTVL